MSSLVARNRAEVLPPSLAPRGLSREQAAAYVGVSTTTFDALVKSGKMPKPKRPKESRTIWDRRQLDRAFDRLPGGDDDFDDDDDWNAEV